MKKIFSIVSAFVLFATLSAQAQTITFDTDDYKAVSVYDAWEGSPSAPANSRAMPPS